MRRSFYPDDLAADATLDGAVFVEADVAPGESLDEAAWIQDASDRGAPIFAAVAHAPLEGDCLDHLLALADLPVVSGIRRQVQNEGKGFALQPEFIAGVGLLERFDFAMDLCVRDHQIVEVTELVRRTPGVRFVLDHLGKPTITQAAFGEWADNLAALAALPNVWCKLSGLATEAPPESRTAEALRPWLAHGLEVFGASRCMFGSDWPVVTMDSTHRDWIQIVESAIGDNASTRKAVFRDTARAFYARR